jgi:hypothetical protein
VLDLFLQRVFASPTLRDEQQDLLKTSWKVLYEIVEANYEQKARMIRQVPPYLSLPLLPPLSSFFLLFLPSSFPFPSRFAVLLTSVRLLYQSLLVKEPWQRLFGPDSVDKRWETTKGFISFLLSFCTGGDPGMDRIRLDRAKLIKLGKFLEK